ncbi:hypothetical protein IKE98_00365 [Candidatus Saccharibacteria bacterium]|nr:hypothetical protein [Candidatus Saccharibacteria bacterium]
MRASRALIATLCSVVFGAISFGTLFFGPTEVKYAIVGTVLSCLVMGHLCYTGCRYVSEWRELLPLILAFAGMAFVAINIALFFPENVSSFVKAVPQAIAAVLLGVILMSFFRYRSKAQGAPKKVLTTAAVASLIMAVVLAAALVASALNKPVEAAPTKKASSGGSSFEYHFYNDDVQKDADPGNDHNFGLPGKSLDADAADAEERERITKDPSKASSTMAWYDVRTGSKFLKKYLEACHGDWEKAMNMAAKAFYKDAALFQKTVKKFLKYLDTADEVYVRPCQTYTSQMYMLKRQGSDPSKIVVYESLFYGGNELVRRFGSKEAAERIECGFQPVGDVAGEMNITPIPDPNPPTPDPDPTKPETDPNKTDNPNGPSYNKDQGQMPPKNTQPGSDKGPGPGTNTGEGSDRSSEDQPENSDHGATVPEIINGINEIIDAGNNQGKPGTPNVPSINLPVDDIDNGADYGGGPDSKTPGSGGSAAPGTTADGPWGGPTS